MTCLLRSGALLACLGWVFCNLPPTTKRDVIDSKVAPSFDAGLDHALVEASISDTSQLDEDQTNLKQALFADVRAYLNAESVDEHHPFLEKIRTTYQGLPFSYFLEAVKQSYPSLSLSTPGVHEESWTNPFDQKSLDYWLYVPQSLLSSTSRKPPYPLLIFLHGAGGTGQAVAESSFFQEAAERLNVILVAPTSHVDCDWSLSEACLSQTVYLVQHLKRKYPIADNEVYLSGFSMGGRGAFSVGAAYPEPYAGIIVGAGTIGAAHETTDLSVHSQYCCPHAENFFNQRLYYFVGDQDVMRLVYQNRGCDLCFKQWKTDYTYTEIEGEGHVFKSDLWEQAVQWAMQKPRDPFPKRVVYHWARQASGIVPGGIWLQEKLTIPQYWAVLNERLDTAENARLEANVENNTIVLKATNVAQATIYFSEELVDFKQPISITHQDKELFHGIVTPDPTLLIIEARRRSERKMLFSAMLTLKVP